MKRLQWVGIQAVEHIGWTGIVALLAICATVVQYIVEVRPLQAELRMLASDATSATQTKPTIATDPTAQLDRFQRFFHARDLETQLQGIHKAGDSTGVTIKRIEYRMLDEQRAKLKQYQIVMPVTNSYPAIRRFIAEVLHTVPAMSLDHIAFSRKRVGDPAVDAELKFTLFLADPT